MADKDETTQEVATIPHENAVDTPQNSPMALAQAFLQSGGDIANLEKMMALQKQYEDELAKKAYVKAMVEAQKKMPVIYEGRKNNQTNSTYSAYKDIVREAKPIYTEAGLSVSFYEEVIEATDYIKMCADVYHENGHSKTFQISLPIDDKGAKGTANKTKLHGVKSAFSYGRGMLLCNIFNIPTSSDVDDDGNSAMKPVFVTEKQAVQLEEMFEEFVDAKDKFRKDFDIDDFGKIPAAKYNKLFSILKAMER